jgi:hypothetical protein
MRIFTTAEIVSGTPTPGWQEEIEAEARRPTDTWREREGQQPRCFRHEETRQEWIAGAWAAVRGETDLTDNCLCEFRRGYDSAASRALAEGGWEAWNLAYREVIERRPIGRSSPAGARYYGREHEAVPAAVARLRAVDLALWKALHGMQGSLLRWAIYRELGLDDAGLRFTISNEFGTVNSGSVEGVPYAGYGCRLFNDSGGKHPRFTYGGWERARALSGSDLVNRSRALLALHAPGTLELAAAPGRMTVPGTIAKADTRMHPPSVEATAEVPAEQLVLI